MTKQQRWLHGELSDWVNDRLIDEQQATQIRARYALPETVTEIPWARIIFSSLGAILIGLGLILLFAFNWQSMHKFIKLAIVFGVLIAAHGFALWYRSRPGHAPALAEGLQILGTMFFGAGIWLIAQIYHIDEHFPTGLLIWGIGALALAWALPSVAQAVIAAILLVIWHGSEVFEFNSINAIAPLIVLFGVGLLAWQQRSQVLLFITGAALYFTVCSSLFKIEDELFFVVIFAMACLYLGLRVLLVNTSSFGILGYLVYLPMLYALSFVDFIGDMMKFSLAHPLAVWYWWIPTVLALIVCSAALLVEITKRRALVVLLNQALILLALILLTLTACVGTFAIDEQLASTVLWLSLIFFNVALFIHGCLFIIEGAQTGSPAKAVLGCLAISAIVVTRYIDLFDHLLLRALAFFILGAIIFIAGNFYSRHKPKPETSA